MTDHAKKRYAKIHHGIYRIIHPLAGKKPGPVNAYLFTGTTVTLLDTGTLKSFPVLQRTLGELGMTCADIDQIVLTHGHIDHYGAAKKVIAAAGGSISLYIEKEGILPGGPHSRTHHAQRLCHAGIGFRASPADEPGGVLRFAAENRGTGAAHRLSRPRRTH